MGKRVMTYDGWCNCQMNRRLDSTNLSDRRKSGGIAIPPIAAQLSGP